MVVYLGLCMAFPAYDSLVEHPVHDIIDPSYPEYATYGGDVEDKKDQEDIYGHHVQPVDEDIPAISHMVDGRHQRV